ncbi:alpha/beta fold hydrolase [Psychromonas aquimarina]|uniref:alpha/beta fold hydrolase n=1 Tax=Psychromonas aquimarina TaxID=444919 RepID=UPI0004064620|nr:alpha/beta fold hydrolase [Psychromonas aquimarina]
MPHEPTLAKPSRSFRLSSLLIRIIEKFTGSTISAEGLENLRTNPTLFVVNHFTRMETALLPQALYKFNGQMVHSLADSSLFVGPFGSFLESVGAHPLNLEGRDEKIISELMSGTYNWVIYPEGSMIKNKKVVEGRRLQLRLPDSVRAPHTGAAILALKTFLMKQEYKRAIADNNEELINYYQETYNLYGPGDLAPQDLCIVPVNISYYPLRPGKNLLSTGVQLLLKDISPEVEEELLVEGRIILEECDISISFGHPIDVRSFTRPYRRFFRYCLPFLSASKTMDWLMVIMRHRLTRIFMYRVYNRLAINMDHLVATALRYVPDSGMAENDFKKVIYLAIILIKSRNNRRVHLSLREGIINLVSDEPYLPYDKMMELVEAEGTALRENGGLFVDQNKIAKPSHFHRMRIENTTSVLANEFEVMRKYVCAIRKLTAGSTDKLSQQVAETAAERDRSIYEAERMRSFEQNRTKSREAGKPRHLKGDADKLGIVLAHGFLASPGEMIELGGYLNQLGYGVYLVRLTGHGTHPKELDTATLKSWLESFKRGYAVLSHYHSKVVLSGFSAGALLAILKSCGDIEKVAGVIAINPALNLRQKSAQFSPLLDSWNKMMESISFTDGALKFVDNDSESPDCNYQQIYIGGLRRLLELQESCRSKLPEVRAPLLIVQGSEDPVVDPSGAVEILDKVRSPYKKLEEIVFKRHVIVRGHASLEVFKVVKKFLETL